MNSPLLQRVGARLLRSSRWQKRAIMLVADALALPVLLWMAFALRFSSFLVPVEPLWLIAACALVPVGFLYALSLIHI